MNFTAPVINSQETTESPYRREPIIVSKIIPCPTCKGTKVRTQKDLFGKEFFVTCGDCSGKGRKIIRESL